MKGRYTGKLRLRQHDDCSGACCRAFTLPAPAELHTAFARMRANEHESDTVEADKISAMLVYLGPSEALPHLVEYVGENKRESHFYTCKHFDGASCTNYLNRPRMCADYPYHSQCTYRDCTARNGGAQGPDCREIEKLVAVDESEEWTTQTLAEALESASSHFSEK